MRTFLALAAFAALAFAAVPSADARDWYVKAEAGSTVNAQINATVGYARRIGERTIVEAQYRYSDADLDGVDLTGGAVTVGIRVRV